VQREASLAAFAHIFPPERYPFPDAAIRRSWDEVLASPDAVVLLAEDADGPAGVVSYFPDRGLLERLFVAPRRWGTGVGSDLHDRAVADRPRGKRAGPRLLRAARLAADRRGADGGVPAASARGSLRARVALLHDSAYSGT
jgi:GNAT superfamily N-acetyltransferase